MTFNEHMDTLGQFPLRSAHSDQDKIVITADSTQIDAFLTCERQWKYGHDERLTPARDTATAEAKPAMLMGTYGHKLMEIYYKALARGESISQAAAAAEEFDPDRELCANCEHLLVHHSGNPLQCIFDTCACSEGTAKPFDLPKPDRAAVLQRFREYVYTHLTNDIVPTSADTVEVGFSEPIFEDDHCLLILEGRIDLIGTLSGMSAIMDHKFQLRERSLYKKAIQFRNYAMVANANMMILNMVRLTKGVGPKTFERHIASFTPQEHAAWRKEVILILTRMAIAKAHTNVYEQNWSACSGKFGYECDFTKLCEESNPQLIEAKKQTLYQIKPLWRPW